MASHGQGSTPFRQVESRFDIFEWHVHVQSCIRYFLDYAQYSTPVQVVACRTNIRLPFQRWQNPILSSGSAAHPPEHMRTTGAPSPLRPGPAGATAPAPPLSYATAIPYIRRLVATGFDNPGVLHGFFGDDWVLGIGPLHEQERMNFLFAAKSDSWLKVKTSYDMEDGQTVPWLTPLTNVSIAEIETAEGKWSDWLAMQDWMLGPRAPGGFERQEGRQSPVIKPETDDDAVL